MTDTPTRHDIEPARPPRVTDGEEKLPHEGHLQHPADLLRINTTTIIPEAQVYCPCCTCVPVAGLRVVLLQQWQDMLRLIVIMCLFILTFI